MWYSWLENGLAVLVALSKTEFEPEKLNRVDGKNRAVLWMLEVGAVGLELADQG